MQKNQQIWFSVLLTVLIVIGFVMYDQSQKPDTLGKKVGTTIDRATGEQQ